MFEDTKDFEKICYSILYSYKGVVWFFNEIYELCYIKLKPRESNIDGNIIVNKRVLQEVIVGKSGKRYWRFQSYYSEDDTFININKDKFIPLNKEYLDYKIIKHKNKKKLIEEWIIVEDIFGEHILKGINYIKTDFYIYNHKSNKILKYGRNCDTVVNSLRVRVTADEYNYNFGDIWQRTFGVKNESKEVLFILKYLLLKIEDCSYQEKAILEIIKIFLNDAKQFKDYYNSINNGGKMLLTRTSRYTGKEELVPNYISGIRKPIFGRFPNNSNNKTFDYLKIEMSIVGYSEETHNFIKRQKSLLAQIGLNALENKYKKIWDKYGIPINVLKLKDMYITTDALLVIVFELKDIKDKVEVQEWNTKEKS